MRRGTQKESKKFNVTASKNANDQNDCKSLGKKKLVSNFSPDGSIIRAAHTVTHGNNFSSHKFSRTNTPKSATRTATPRLILPGFIGRDYKAKRIRPEQCPRVHCPKWKQGRRWIRNINKRLRAVYVIHTHLTTFDLSSEANYCVMRLVITPKSTVHHVSH